MAELVALLKRTKMLKFLTQLRRIGIANIDDLQEYISDSSVLLHATTMQSMEVQALLKEYRHVYMSSNISEDTVASNHEISISEEIFQRKMTMTSGLKQQMMQQHDQRIESLNKKYAQHINNLLLQKRHIMEKMQNLHLIQMKRIGDLNKAIIMSSKQNVSNEVEMLEQSAIEEVLQYQHNMDSLDGEPIVNNNKINVNPHDNMQSNDRDASSPSSQPKVSILQSLQYRQKKSTKPNKKKTKKAQKETKPTKYKCIHCNKAYVTKYYLTEHIRKHTGEKPYLCKYCDEVFRTRDQFAAHTARHTEKYKCTHCNKVVGTKQNLIRHARIHTGEKPYKCNHCIKAFTRKYQLTCHIRTHTGEKPYKCSQCNKLFGHKCNLIRHIGRLHKGQKSI